MTKKEKVKIAINGFGRIGRISLRAWWQRNLRDVDLAAINTTGLMEAAEWAHLLKYDSVYGHFPAKIETIGPEKAGEIGRIVVGGTPIPILGERDPKKIPWSRYGVD